MQLLPPLPVNPTAVSVREENELENDPATAAKLFEDDDVQNLWKQGAIHDKDWRRARDAVRAEERGFPPGPAYKLSANIAECTVAADGVPRGRENRVWVPDYEPLRTAIMQKTHDSHLTGRPGKDTMVGVILRRWFWPKLRDSVHRFIRNCDICGRTNVWREAKAGFLRSLLIPERIGSGLTIDFVTDLPPSEGCTDIMNCARLFIDRYYKYFGFPSYLTCDGGSNWTSHFWKTFCHLTGITQNFTTSYHPQSNASERANQEIYKYLRVFTCYAQDDRMNLLPLAQLALNGRPNTAIGGMSPFFLRYGYHIDPLMEPTPHPDQTVQHPGKHAATDYARRLRDAQDFAQATMASVQQRNEQKANRSRRQPERFQVGDKIWLDLRHIKTPQLSKRLAWQHHKYEVTAIPDALTVELNVPGNIHNRFHIELVKRAGNDPFPSQVCDDAQNPPITDDLEEPEYEVESILRARTVRRGRGSYRQALVKWVGWADPTWEPVINLKYTAALNTYEETYGPIETHDGPQEQSAGIFVGPAEKHTMEKRRARKKKRN
ncbi:hypothetical protein K3495_g8416 [Podosphaera aphanis]|nr:hypothetical protein K3495_g8416 [Podosphaera aphanis]